MRLFFTLLAASLLLVPGSPAWSAPRQDLQAIGKQVEGFVRQSLPAQSGRPLIQVGPIDKRLQLAQCNKLEMQNFGSANRAARTIQVRCQAPASWTLYVPVSVKLMTLVVVATRPLAQGHSLTSGDLRLSEQDLASLPAGVLSDTNMALGQVLASNIPAGFCPEAGSIAGSASDKAGTEPCHGGGGKWHAPGRRRRGLAGRQAGSVD